MIYFSLVFSLFIGYVIGLMQNGIRIYHKEDIHVAEQKYHESVGIDHFKEYYESTDGVNKF